MKTKNSKLSKSEIKETFEYLRRFNDFSDPLDFDEDDYYEWYEEYTIVEGAEIEKFPGCCGMSIVHDLSCNSPIEQAILLLAALEGFSVRGNNNSVEEMSGLVLITDTVGSKDWRETKSVAIQGPVVINPNTKNKICTWQVTKDMIPLIWNIRMLPKLLVKKPLKKKSSNKKLNPRHCF